MFEDQITQPEGDASDALSPQSSGSDETAYYPNHAPVSSGDLDPGCVESPDEALLHVSSFRPELDAEDEPIPGATADAGPQEQEDLSDGLLFDAISAFDWEAGKPTVWNYEYSDGKTWHQVGYRDTPQGRQMFERGIPIKGKTREWTEDMSRVLRVPYNVAEVNRREVLILVHSEAAVELLNHKLRGAKKAKYVTATTTAGGLGNARSTNIANYAFKKAVVVLPTNDEEGLRHANEVCHLVPRAAHRKIVELPRRSPGGGVENFFGAGGTVAELIQHIKDAPDWTP